MAKLLWSLLITLLILVHPTLSQNNNQNEYKENTLPSSLLNFNDTFPVKFDNLSPLSIQQKIQMNRMYITNYNSVKKPILYKWKPKDLNTCYMQHNEIIRNRQFMQNFVNSDEDWIFSNFFITSNSNKTYYNGLGEFLQIGIGLKCNPSHKLSFETGYFFSRQYNFLSGSRSDIYGLNTITTYSLTSNVQFNIYGQYAGNSNSNIFYGNTLFPNSNIGSSLLFKVKNHTLIDLGVKYQYYEYKKVWDLESASKISVGF